ncbi:MAG: acetyl-CoA carboxylase biotin carboxyl carrier protein subunit [Anaerolineales bacterium]|nr:acetyl-CoA carboxylase biotin carboxyl carrier protein subunit [Anaerolineales bacterium]MDW8277665.1 acetyl-CoA carboxylase biotin carboxyl carrier protein subunit [Anaerolineales bacterium]
MKYITTIEDKEYRVEIVDEKHIRINDQLLEVDLVAVGGQPVYSLLISGKSYEAYIYPEEKEWQVLLRGQQYKAVVEDEREKRLKTAGGARAESGEFHLKAPMPGLVVSVPVEEGQSVKKGQVLVILESMKMQNELKSPRDGTVHRIRVRAGESVEQRQTLLSVT